MKNLRNSMPPITSHNIITGELRPFVPELYQQSTTIEINPWHDRQSVFDHTVAVVAAMETILKFDFLYKDSRLALEQKLAARTAGYSLRDVALYSALLHDIGKSSTFKTDPVTGQTNCPGHGEAGARIARTALSRCNISKLLASRILVVVSRHGDVHETVNKILTYTNQESEWAAFSKKNKSLYIVYVLLGYADVEGSTLKQLNHIEYKKRVLIHQQAINRFAAGL